MAMDMVARNLAILALKRIADTEDKVMLVDLLNENGLNVDSNESIGAIVGHLRDLIDDRNVSIENQSHTISELNAELSDINNYVEEVEIIANEVLKAAK